MTFFYYQHQFVNRESELNAFTNLLNHPHRRILLFRGPREIGKSWIIRRLNQQCKDTKTLSALVDLGGNSGLTTPEKVIQRIREELRGAFDQHMAQAENQIHQDLGENTAPIFPKPDAGNKGSDDSDGQSSSGSLNVTGDEVTIEGDTYIGDKYVNSTFIVNPANGNIKRLGEADFRRNRACREALKQLLAKQRLVLFFDHFEKATENVANWLHSEILNLFLESPGDFPNLWVVIAGHEVPFQNEADRLRHILHLEEVGPFEKEAVHTYWKEKRKLDLTKLSLSLLMDLCLGKPQTLCLIANNYEISLGR